MNLHEATEAIRTTSALLNRDYQDTLFDEFAIVQRRGDQDYLLWYEGPRREDFIAKFAEETACLKAEARSRWTNRYEVGDFEFSPDGEGSKSEAFIIIGKSAVLICGNTSHSMPQLAAKPTWLKAQRHFVNLSDKFRFKPLDFGANSPEGTAISP